MAGYIGSKASVVSSGAERKKVFNITGATTSLTGCNYTVGKVQVFQNGVRLLDGTDYTATDGTTVTLTVAAQSGDNVVVLSFASYQVALSGIDDQSNAVAMTIDSNENVLIGKTSLGVANAGFAVRNFGSGSGGGTTIELAKDDATAMYLNRTSSDGEIIALRKDNTSVGSIGVKDSTNSYIGSGASGFAFAGSGPAITPYNTTANNYTDNTIDLGNSFNRFKDIYTSGGIHLGGTGSANKLEDYEEGTWTASFSGTTATNIGNTTGYYTKIGNTVHFSYYSSEVDLANAVTGGARINGLPFNSSNSTQRYGLFLTSYGNAIQNESNGGFVAKGSNYLVFMIQESNAETTWYNGTNKRIMVAGTYMVD